jgi:RNA polymerase sigma factor (sigma-70 family)
MPGSPEEWILVVERLLAGDRLAFLKVNRLITSFLTQLGAYDFRDEWDDLRQEVVLSIVAAARAGRLRDPSALLAYVQSITRNKLYDRLGRAGRQHEKQHVPWDEAAPALAAQTADPSRDGTGDVWREVANLSPQQRLVLEGIYREGKTYEQVARDSGIPLGTLKRRLREGLDELRQRLRDPPSPRAESMANPGAVTGAIRSKEKG